VKYCAISLALKGNDKLVLAKELQHLCHQYDVPFIVNDEVSLAIDDRDAVIL
jgi:thiamine monophosphate synthase